MRRDNSSRQRSRQRGTTTRYGTHSFAFDQVAAKAPSQIRSSAQTLRSSYQRILSALGSTDLNQNPQALTTAASTVVKGQETRLASAGQQVTDYTKRTCGVDFSASGGSTTTTKP